MSFKVPFIGITIISTKRFAALKTELATSTKRRDDQIRAAGEVYEVLNRRFGEVSKHRDDLQMAVTNLNLQVGELRGLVNGLLKSIENFLVTADKRFDSSKVSPNARIANKEQNLQDREALGAAVKSVQESLITKPAPTPTPTASK